MNLRVLITMLFVTLVSFGQQNDLIKSNLNGKVKTVRTIRYRAIQKKKKVKLGAVLPMSNYQVIYNTKGNDSIKCHFRFIDDTHILSDSTIFIYGAFGKLKGLKYNADGLYGYSKFIYKKDSVLEKVEFYDLKDSINQTWHYRYLDNGQIEITEKLKFDSTSYSIHTYNSNHSRLKSEYYRNNEIWYSRIFNSDKNRAETSWIYSSNGLESEYQCIYEFDEQENWVKKTEILDGKAVYVTRRSIEYYE